jgi:hypothetical protein
LLLPIPTTATDLKSIASQFNKFYGTNYSYDQLDPDKLNLGAKAPAINNLTGAGTALVTAKSFVVANTSGNLAKFACVEMDDAIIARTAAGKTAFGSIRNISDPIQNSALPERFQGHWGEAIYTAYGLYTSYNGAIAAWAVLSSLPSGTSIAKTVHVSQKAQKVPPPRPMCPSKARCDTGAAARKSSADRTAMNGATLR